MHKLNVLKAVLAIAIAYMVKSREVMMMMKDTSLHCVARNPPPFCLALNHSSSLPVPYYHQILGHCHAINERHREEAINASLTVPPAITSPIATGFCGRCTACQALNSYLTENIFAYITWSSLEYECVVACLFIIASILYRPHYPSYWWYQDRCEVTWHLFYAWALSALAFVANYQVTGWHNCDRFAKTASLFAVMSVWLSWNVLNLEAFFHPLIARMHWSIYKQDAKESTNQTVEQSSVEVQPRKANTAPTPSHLIPQLLAGRPAPRKEQGKEQEQERQNAYDSEDEWLEYYSRPSSSSSLPRRPRPNTRLHSGVISRMNYSEKELARRG